MIRAITLGALASMAKAAAPGDDYLAALQRINWTEVDDDIRSLLTTPNPVWQADYGNYGPLMIRLAWHCSGSYRQSDGRGGCDGARIRFSPEADWADNANLNHARELLEPIKAKYGLGLSHGDLYIRTGNVAIASMGGPVLGFCAGRMDDADGSASLNYLGPSAAQAENYPCPVQGDCKKESGLGPTTIGLIYVNPEGPQANGVPMESAPQIRDTFSRMGMNDTEAVALIGGGHAFGKSHGACANADGAGSPPTWNGSCTNFGGVTGQGPNTVTSGFEGPWTTNPTRWSNQYYNNLLQHNWTLFNGSGGHKQFQIANGSATAPQVNNASERVPINMLVADIALTTDTQYVNNLKIFANNQSALEQQFAAAWYKLTTGDMGPSKRCYGNNVPPPQPFQHDLPNSTLPAVNYSAVKADIRRVLYASQPAAGVTPDFAGQNRFGAQFAQLAWQCASTYRATDYRGGCNGARIRFAPESGFQANQALGTTALLSMLNPVKAKYNISWADLIVLAGHTGVEDILGFGMPFCGGRTDAVDGSGSEGLNPPNWTNPIVNFREKAARMGLTDQEAVLLAAVPRKGLNVTGIEYFAQLAEDSNSTDADSAYTGTDFALRNDSGLFAIVEQYRDINQATFQTNFTNAWNKVMNADYFIGWNGLVCPSPVAATTPPPISAEAPTSASGSPPYSSASTASIGFAALFASALFW